MSLPPCLSGRKFGDSQDSRKCPSSGLPCSLQRYLPTFPAPQASFSDRKALRTAPQASCNLLEDSSPSIMQPPIRLWA